MKTRLFFFLRSCKTELSAVIFIFGLQATFGQTPIVRNVVPPVWQGDDVNWVRDQRPHNRIDDAIDSSPDQLFDVIVNFSHCPTDPDITFIANNTQSGRIQMRSKYISSVFVARLSKAEIRNLAAYPGVAFIEQQGIYVPHLNVSLPAICLTPGPCSPNTVQEAFPGIDGAGINIAIIDSGVDNSGASANATFAATPFIGGYDATAAVPVEIDPDDDISHGTHVASIALGQGGGTVPRGVAPRAGLIDVKVFRSGGFMTTDAVIFDAVEHVYNRRASWGVNVINMSLGVPFSDADGKEAICQLIDLAESMGIVVVISAGNEGPVYNGIPKPGAATRAITVAGAETHNTAMRSDETIACFSNPGPRADDGDSDIFDERKPEVAAPGTHQYNNAFCTPITGILGAQFNSINASTRKSGTSMAAPHVTGLAALIVQAKPGINAASVKDLILSTATDPSGAPQAWQADSGYGYINAFAAISAASATDITFPSYPPPISWLSPDISIAPDPAKKDMANTATVQIKNAGLNPANNVRVHFGVHVFSAATPTFQDIGTVVVPTIAGGAVVPVSINWKPANSSHQCLQVEIGYGADTDFSNNTAQRNLDVQASPKQFMVQNTATEEPALIELRPTLGTNSNGGSNNWTFTLEPRQLVLAADDCPVPVSAQLFPGPDVPPGERQTLHVAAVVNTFFGPVLLGGVTIAAVKPMPPTITTQPRGQQAPCGSTVIFSVAAIGADPLTYQWQYNGVDLPGATQPTLSISPVQPNDAGTYRVRVSNSAGSVTSANATLSVLPGTAPHLTVALVNSNVLIRWPVSCADYDLQETPTLNFPINWMQATASVGLQGSNHVATAPLQPAGNRFFRLAQRPSGAIPHQPPEIPLFEYSEFDPTPIGATDIQSVPWQEIPGSLTDEMERHIRFAAQQNPLVRSQLGERYAYLTTSTREMPKGQTNDPAQPLQTDVTFFSHTFNWTVLASMSGTTVVGVSNSTALQPPEGADEVAAAVELARRDPRLSELVQGLIGGGLLVVIETQGQPGFGHRVIYVTFSRPDEAAPRFVALVDLTLQEVLSVATP